MLCIRRSIRLGSAGALLGGLAVGVAGLSPLSGGAEEAPTTATPNQPISESLNSVSCTSTTNCIAVGYQSNTVGPGPQTTLTEKWNGASWSVAPSPNPGNNVNVLNGVSCTASTNCVAVGYYFNSSAGQTITQTLIEQWNGTSWSVTPSPDQGSGGNVLFRVFCTSSTNCVAVGDYINGSGDFQTLIETWNGTGWSIIPSPDPGSSSSGLEGVYCISSTNCLAVGYYFNGPSTQGLVETWNGTIWSVSPSPNPADAGNLASVSCTSATNCVAVGDYINGSGSQVLIESWNGSIWSVTTGPNPGRDTLSSVSCISSTNCIAVGNYFTGSGNQTGLIESWNGISWSVTPSPSPGANAYLYGLSCISSTGCFAVGQTFDKSNASQVLVESWNGTSWSVVLGASETSTSTVLTSTAAVEGQTTTLTATVKPTSGGGAPTGSVLFIDWTTGSLLGSVALSGGAASLNTVFPEEGSHLVSAVYTGDSNFLASHATQTITVTDASLSGQSPSAPLQGGEGVPSFAQAVPVSGVVASFTDADPGGTVSDYGATIDWGDGTTSAGTVGTSGSGFTVSGSHTYQEDGNYPVIVHIGDVGGSTTSVDSSAHVSEPTNFLAFLVDLFFERFGF